MDELTETMVDLKPFNDHSTAINVSFCKFISIQVKNSCATLFTTSYRIVCTGSN